MTLEPELAAALGIEDLSHNDQLAYLSQHGDKLLASTLSEFEPLLNAQEQNELSAFLETEPEPEELLNHLVKNYETFLALLKSAAAELTD